MYLASTRTLVVVVTDSLMIFGFLLYIVIEKLKEKKWVVFIATSVEKDEIDEEAYVGLLLEGSSVKKGDLPEEENVSRSLEGIAKFE
jgi:hypothetical protein